jgi:nucleotide sugar dehydrogenase
MDFDPDKTIHTTNFSAESIKYVSNSFLATCISFTNEVFTSINSDPDFNYRDVLLGWHSDKRLNFDEHEPLPLKKYLIPGIGYGGSCFPKDVLAFNQYSQMGEGTTSVLRSVIEANKKITLQISDWIKECIPPSETVILLGLGFKENTDDMRESPSLKLWQELSNYFENLYWYDSHIETLDKELNKRKLSPEEIKGPHNILLSNHSPEYRKMIMNNYVKGNSITRVLALRYQEPMENVNWIYPRKESYND